MNTPRVFLESRGPLAFAHRGGAREAPENTLPAFAAAVAMGYRYLETDVQRSADGVLVAIHDPMLDRVSDLRGLIRESPLARIRQADAGYRFTTDGGASFPFRGQGITVPTLEELLERWPQARFNIDVKSDSCVAPLVALLQRLNALDRVCIGSFSDRRLGRIRSLTHAGVCTSAGRTGVLRSWLASRRGRMPLLRADCLQVPLNWRGRRVADRRLIEAAHRSGLQVHVWTVDDPGLMHQLLDLDVDGIMTDRPALLRNVLLERGAWNSGGSNAGGAASP